MGVSVVVAMTLLAVTGTLPPAKVLSGFSNLTVWMVFVAFLFSRAVTATGFGTRVGYIFVERFARTPLSLGYSIAAADLVLAPFIPSDTARGGGMVYPIARSVASALGSEPGPTAGRIGSFLTLVSFHITYPASAIFLTGMAANPLIAEFAFKIGHVELTWMRWFSGSVVPGICTLALIPWLLHRWVKPDLKETGPARELARPNWPPHGSAQPRRKMAGRHHARGRWPVGDRDLARDSEHVRGAGRSLGNPAGASPHLGRPALREAAPGTPSSGSPRW